jgi:hypothetical protein
MTVIHGSARLIGWAIAGALAVVSIACGGSPPSGPSPQPTPTPPPSTNTPPVVEGITASAPRVEVDGTVTLTATVRDTETPIGQLQYSWRADAGSFDGTGATVMWRAPREVAAATNYTIALTVTENYDGGARQNVVNANGPTVRVHDSNKELGELALRFLGDFANSSVSASSCVRDFSVNCPGREQEKSDIEDNRRRYQVIGSSLRLTGARVTANGTRGDMDVACSFTSRVIHCDPPDPSDPETLGCVVGAVGTSGGVCSMTAVYEQDRWWLCTSTFDANGLAPPGFRKFLSSRRR